MGRILCVTFFSLMLAGGALAMEEPALTGSEIERYNKVTHELIAPCCWREPIAVHRSAEAQQMLDEVKQLVLEGRSEEQIKTVYVARYGLRILADPPGKEGKWLYVVPVALSFCLFFLVILYLRSLVANVCPGATPLDQRRAISVMRRAEPGRG
ncbi:MAG: cytochrome c-type biogenesis protein CcmH [Terriglobia bacterium]